MVTKKIWGKFVGGFLGYSMGGPLGAILGIIVGHIHDTHKEVDQNAWAEAHQSYAGFSGSPQQVTFTVGVIVLGAKMAKADGRVTRAEIDTFKRVFHINPQQAAQVGRVFDGARQSAEGFEPYAQQLAQTFRYNTTVLEEILGGLFMIAAADSAGLSPAEMRFLQTIAVIFSIERDDFFRIAVRAGVRIPNAPEARKEHDESYTILGLDEKASPDDIKLAYRALIRKYHPDKLMAQGLPPEYIETANEKMKRINVAYDTLCKAKGIK